MAKLTHVSVVLVGVVAGTAALAAVMSTGCSSSTSSSSVDSGTDGTASQFDGSQTQFDGSTGQADAPTGADVVTPPADGGAGDAPTVDSGLGADSAVDANDAADAEDASDAPTACTTILGLTGPVAETDAGPATDAGDAAAEASATDATAGDAAAEASATDATAGDATSEAAADAAASDATTDAAASDATTGDAAASDATTGDGSAATDATADALVDAGNYSGPALIAAFDSVTGVPAGWSLNVQDPMDAGLFVPVLGSTLTEGATCLGALEVTAAFTAFGQTVQAQLPNGSYQTGVGGQDWTGRKTLHCSAKVIATTAGFAGLAGVQLFIQSGGAGYPNYRGSYANISTFTDEAFHEISLDLSLDDAGDPDGGNGAYNPTQVDQIGVQILDLMTTTDAGTTPPPSAVLLVDDIWVE